MEALGRSGDTQEGPLLPNGSSDRLVDGKLLKKAKRQRFLDKQQAKEAASTTNLKPEWHSWIERNSSFAYLATEESIKPMRKDPTSRLYPYFELQERNSVTDRSNGNEQLFIAEGTETIRVLLQQLKNSSYPLAPVQVKSIFIKPSVMFDPPVKLLADVEHVMDTLGRKPCDVIIAKSPTVHTLVAGFEISRGALACGVVPTGRDWRWLLEYLRHRQTRQQSPVASIKPLRLVALDGVSDTANLGSIIRTAAAFSVDAILLSSSCCDAWYRRTIRVSMGHVFNVPCVRVNDMPTAIRQLSQEPFCVAAYAAVVQRDADLVLEQVNQGGISSSWMAVFGSESSGISQEVVAACDYTLRIGMNGGVDSLSLPIATGILLHGLGERSRRPGDPSTSSLGTCSSASSAIVESVIGAL